MLHDINSTYINAGKILTTGNSATHAWKHVCAILDTCLYCIGYMQEPMLTHACTPAPVCNVVSEQYHIPNLMYTLTRNVAL